MLKRILVFLLLAAVWSGDVFGAFQFNEKDITINRISRKENYLTFDGQTEVFLNFSDPIYDFGYYNIGMQGEIQLVSGDRKTGYLGSFDENDQIGIWIKPKGFSPYRYTSTDISHWNPRTKFVGTEYEVELEEDDGKEELEIEFTIGNRLKWDDGGWEVGGLEFEILAPYQGQGGGPVPSGQPLPGILASLLTVIAASGIYVFLSRKKVRKLAA